MPDISMARSLLPGLVDRLPPFNGHWPAETQDRWYEWFFALLDAAQQRSHREAIAADFGLPLQMKDEGQ